MTTLLAAVTAAHPYWSGIGIWIVLSVIATRIWAMCKERDDEDEVIVLAPPRQSSYTPPSLSKPAAKGFRRVS